MVVRQSSPVLKICPTCGQTAWIHGHRRFLTVCQGTQRVGGGLSSIGTPGNQAQHPVAKMEIASLNRILAVPVDGAL